MMLAFPHDAQIERIAVALESIGLVIDGKRDSSGVWPVRWIAQVPPYVRAVRRDTQQQDAK